MTRSVLEQRLEALERRLSVLEARAYALRRPGNRRVLELLHTFAESPTNDGSLTMDVNSIAMGTMLEAKDLALALNELHLAQFIELVSVDSTGHWRITEDGRQELV